MITRLGPKFLRRVVILPLGNRTTGGTGLPVVALLVVEMNDQGIRLRPAKSTRLDRLVTWTWPVLFANGVTGPLAAATVGPLPPARKPRKRKGA